MITIEAPPGFELAAMLSEVKRELGLRGWLYSVRVAEGKMTAHQANQQISAMRSVLTLLEGIRDAAAQSRCQAQGRLEG